MSRLRLGGYGPPIPVPEDLAEVVEDTTRSIPPRVSYFLEDGSIFRPPDYVDLHYTHYEVIVIGAVGGRSGIVTGSQVGLMSAPLVSGGAGGGGGLQVVSGLLVDLPDEIPITVGQPGASNIMADSEDGGFSKFGEVAKASGGKGGKVARPYHYWDLVVAGTPDPYNYDRWRLYEFLEVWTKGGDGGNGGKGGRTAAGGGALGARWIPPIKVAPPGPPAPPFDTFVFDTRPQSFSVEDGKWDPATGIGEGGGGGIGGCRPPVRTDQTYFQYSPRGLSIASDGGVGAFNYGDTTRSMPGERVSSVQPAGAIIPGHGGGASTNRRTLGSNYGGYERDSPEQSHPGGVVFIRLRRKP